MRAAYVGAAGRLSKALIAFDNSGTPMDPGPGPEPYPWTREQVAIIREVADAFAKVIEARRTWDAFRRERHTVR